MRLKVVLAAVAVTVTGALLPANPAAADVEPYIIGGGTVSSAPWAAAVFRSGSFTCSGTIIAATWVLTARHCTSSSMQVRVGSVNRTSGGVTANVVTFSTRYDLAVLRLDRSISTSYMPLASSSPPVGSNNNIYGWGMTCYSGCSASTVLKTAVVRVTGSSSDAYGGPAIASTRVTGNAWRGDSGGPQTYNGLQVGVASTADGQSRQFYGSVAASRSWIRSVTGV
ncbi:MAG TPA: trypsin-like serine protease [Candidatus Limnocylindrales bacterium]